MTELYLSVHGDAGLEPRTQRAGELVQRKVRPDAMWDDRRRESARAQYMTVLRPTVDCNQDCWFCSANETSRNVQRDAARMSRKILRLARTGITHLSFSGGEPTLSRHLLEHVALARAAGIPVVELVTNAVLLDREDKVDAFVRAGVTNLFVSLHGHDEATSRAQTRKVGDHARTTRALQLFVARSDVLIRLNHVITAKNFRSLVRFVEWVGGLFGPRVSISFAYLTPQYKALERLGEVLPTYTEVMPYLKKALARATELGIECVVGSRQGVPACLLGDFAILSDVTGIASNAEVEDARQKIKPPSCASCRLNDLCTGVWRPYAEVHGTGELVPMSGPPIAAHDDLADALGVRALPPSAELVVAPEPPRRRALDVLPDLPPLRVAIVGTGARALRILSAAAEAGLVVVGVASPHAPDKELPLPSEVTRARSLDELVATNVQIDAVIVASATRDHAASARAALSRGLPVLVEKPLAADAAEATALVELGGANLAVAHQMRMAGGFQELVREARAHEGRLGLRVRHAVAAGSAGAMHTWSRGQLFESLVHLLDLVTAILGVDVVLESARGVGATLPESMDVSGRGARGTFHLSSELRAADDGLEVVLSLGARRVTFQRGPGGEELTTVDALGARSRSAARGSDHTRMLEAWARSVREGKPPPVGAEDGVVAMRLASDAIRRLEASGVPFDRAHAPRHASSRELKERYD